MKITTKVNAPLVVNLIKYIKGLKINVEISIAEGETTFVRVTKKEIIKALENMNPSSKITYSDSNGGAREIWIHKH